MSIIMYSMEFGDCFLIKNDDNNTGLLCDCGSNVKIDSAIIQRIYNHIIKLDRAELLITHFHSDHTNKLDDLIKMHSNFGNSQNLFKKIYLPNIYFSDKIDIEMIVFLFLYGQVTLAANVGTAFLKFLETLMKLNLCFLDIEFLHKGIPFTSSYRNITLWPLSNFTLFKKLKKNHYDTIKQDFYTPEMTEQIEQICTDLKEIIAGIRKFSKEGRKNEVEKNDYYYYLKHMTSMFFQKLNNVVKQINYTIKKGDELYKSIQRYADERANQNSIVFSDYKKEKYLMTGDVTTANLKKIIKEHNLNKIRIIKAPHHGTFKCPHILPDSDYIMIPYGKYSGGPKKIRSEYKTYNHDVCGSHIFCSNGNIKNGCDHQGATCGSCFINCYTIL